MRSRFRKSVFQQAIAVVALAAMFTSMGCQAPVAEQDPEPAIVAQPDESGEELAINAMDVLVGGKLSPEAAMPIAKNQLMALVDSGCLDEAGFSGDEFDDLLAICIENPTGATCDELAQAWYSNIDFLAIEPPACDPQLVDDYFGAITAAADSEPAQGADYGASSTGQQGSQSRKFGEAGFDPSSSAVPTIGGLLALLVVIVAAGIVLWMVKDRVCCEFEHAACHNTDNQYARCVTHAAGGYSTQDACQRAEVCIKQIPGL